jgi:hypothetical protein
MAINACPLDKLWIRGKQFTYIESMFFSCGYGTSSKSTEAMKMIYKLTLPSLHIYEMYQVTFATH